MTSQILQNFRMRVVRGGGYMSVEESNKIRRKIELAIKKQLKEKQVYQFAHYQDLVNDYMKFWDFKNMLQEDIKERGVSIYWQNSETQYGYKKNDSIGDLIKVNTQMLKILFDLGVRASDLEAVEEDEGL